MNRMRFGGISVLLLIYAMMPKPLPGGIPSGELHVYSLSRQGWHVLKKSKFRRQEAGTEALSKPEARCAGCAVPTPAW